MIENRPWLTIFSHTMLILGIAGDPLPLYVAFVAATLDKQEVYAAPMTLIPRHTSAGKHPQHLGKRGRHE